MKKKKKTIHCTHKHTKTWIFTRSEKQFVNIFGWQGKIFFKIDSIKIIGTYREWRENWELDLFHRPPTPTEQPNKNFSHLWNVRLENFSSYFSYETDQFSFQNDNFNLTHAISTNVKENGFKAPKIHVAQNIAERCTEYIRLVLILLSNSVEGVVYCNEKHKHLRRIKVLKRVEVNKELLSDREVGDRRRRGRMKIWKPLKFVFYR